MTKILANDGIHPDGKLVLEDAGFEVITEKVPQDQLSTELPKYEVIIVRSATKVREALIDACPNLKVIARAGVGLDNIDKDYAESKGIKVINTPAASSLSVAELTFGHMFNLARSLHLSNREMPEKGTTEFKRLKKSYSKGFELRGKTLGILGFGRIGQNVAQIGLTLGMKVLPVDLYVEDVNLEIQLFDTEKTSISAKISTVSMDEMLSQCDILTIHIPGSKAIIGATEIAKMKPGSYIMNISRGGLIDEDALLAALESGHIAAAALDSFVGEPTPNPTLLNHPRISVSPHIGGSTVEAQANIGRELADKIIAFYDR